MESGIHNLEQRGLGRVRERGKERFEQVFAWSIVAANVHRIGQLVQPSDRWKLKYSRAIRKGLLRRRKAA